MSLFSMLEEVKKSLRPDGSLLAVRDSVLATINRELEKRGVQARASGGGSVAKNTYLAGDHDVDIFVRFSLDYIMEEEKLPDIVEQVIKGFKPTRLHGSRDYFQFTHKGYDFEIIPVLAVSSSKQARNVTDMSPLHVEYFMAKNNNQEDEVRLAKQFCKSAHVYGAESYIRGFSGHVVDILVLHYGTFYDFVKAAAKWKAPVIIDTQGHHANPLSAIDVAKHAPLILVDPVQPERNAAAALDYETFDRFIMRCKEFLKNPSEEFFIVESFDEMTLRNRLSQHSGACVLVRANHPKDDKKDVAGARIRKAYDRLIATFKREGFTLVEDGWSFAFGKQSVLWFCTEEHSLPRIMEREGPPLHAEKDVQQFREIHKGAYERDGRVYAKIERTIQYPQDIITHMSEDLEKHVHVSVQVEVLGAKK